MRFPSLLLGSELAVHGGLSIECVGYPVDQSVCSGACVPRLWCQSLRARTSSQGLCSWSCLKLHACQDVPVTVRVVPGCACQGLCSRVCVLGCACQRLCSTVCGLGCTWQGQRARVCVLQCVCQCLCTVLCVSGCVCRGVHSRSCVAGSVGYGVLGRSFLPRCACPGLCATLGVPLFLPGWGISCVPGCGGQAVLPRSVCQGVRVRGCGLSCLHRGACDRV